MPPRKNNSITMMIAQAQEKLREIKELQFFGGDALNLKRYSHTFVVPVNANPYACFRIVMTPSEPGHTMPIDVGRKPANAATRIYSGKVERVPRTDGKFEYLIMFDQQFAGETSTMEFYVIYSGAATFELIQVY